MRLAVGKEGMSGMLQSTCIASSLQVKGHALNKGQDFHDQQG